MHCGPAFFVHGFAEEAENVPIKISSVLHQVNETGQIGMCHPMDAQTSHPQNLQHEKSAFKVFQ